MTKTYELPRFLDHDPGDSPANVLLLAKLTACRVEGNAFIMTCESNLYKPSIHDFYGTPCEVIFSPGDPDQIFTCQLDFCTPEIIRVRVSPGEQVPENNTPMVVGQFDAPVTLNYQEDETHVRLETDALQVEIQKAPWQVIVSDQQGNRIWATKPVDIPPLLRPEIQWNPPQERWLFLHRYAYPVGAQLGDRQRVFASFDLDHDEHIYGLGEDFGRLDKRNIHRKMWLQEGFGNASPAAYKQTPFYMSSKGYGLFVNASNAMSFNVGHLEHTTLSLILEDTSLLDFYVIYGPTFKDILPRYTHITGKPGLPPDWSFGLWMGRITYDNQKQVEEVADALRDHQIPCDVIHVDTGWYEKEWVCDLAFSKERFPDPAEMTRHLHDQGFHLCLWQLPILVIESGLFTEAAEKGYLVKRPNGVAYLSSGFLSDAGLIDYSNPEAVGWIKQKFRDLFELGVDVIKVDFGEGAPPDGVYHGYPGTSMHNLYPLLYNQAVFEVTEDFYGEGQAMIWGRAAWAGSQRYPVHWSGDGIARYEDLACVLRSALSFGMSGFPFYSHDVGGFSGLPSPELYVRWIQLGAFTSHVRCHGQPPREPWAYGEVTENLFRQYMDLRYSLMPYILSEARWCVQSSQPMLRALVLDYQDDPTTSSIEDQFLFGRSLLVAPILKETNTRKVYLPDGNWIDYWTRAVISGPKWIDVEAPLETIPLYVKAGAIIPYGPKQQYIGEKACDPLTVEVYTPENEHAYAVVDSQMGQIPITYACEGNRIVLNIGRSVGQVIVKLIGADIESASLAEDQPLLLETTEDGCCQVTIDAQAPQEIIFVRNQAA